MCVFPQNCEQEDLAVQVVARKMFSNSDVRVMLLL